MANETETHVVSYWEFKGKEQFVDDWFLMSSPVPIAIITFFYLLFILKLGPDFMKNRPPYKLKSTLLLYNFIQVLASCLLFQYGVSLITPEGLLNASCSLERNSANKVAFGIYLYLFAKISELLDTVFFILRKKYEQVTFLHIYHHTIMMVATWVILKFEPSYAVVFLGTLNSFVHIIMYAYYGLSAIPGLAKFLWWKKYITTMQLVQFLAVVVQAIINFSLSGCPPSYLLISFITANSMVFFYLFSDFYVKAYLKNRKEKAERAAENIKKRSCNEECYDNSEIRRRSNSVFKIVNSRASG